MSNKHTPGPWVAKEFTCLAATTIIAEDGTPIADTTGFGRRADDCLADARLIAAAPDLLEYVQMVANLPTDAETDGGMTAADAIEILSTMIAVARAVLDEATGD